MFNKDNRYFENYVIAIHNGTPVDELYASAKNELIRVSDCAETEAEFAKTAELGAYCNYLESVLAAYYMRSVGYYVDDTKYLPEWTR